jgi:competence protein ComEC
MVGLGATVVRAAIMALIAISAKFLGRPSDALRWLFIAGFLMLLWNPLSLLYDPSFQLSFMATLGLIIFSPFVFDFISKNKIGKLVPQKYGIREIVAATLSVQLFILPLLIRMSGEVSLISFLVNPLVLPLVPAIMALGALTGGVGLIPFIGKMISWPLGVLAYFSSQIIIWVTELGASLPLSSLPVGTLPPLAIIFWYVGYAVLYWKINKENQKQLSLR